MNIKEKILQMAHRMGGSKKTSRHIPEPEAHDWHAGYVQKRLKDQKKNLKRLGMKEVWSKDEEGRPYSMIGSK